MCVTGVCLGQQSHSMQNSKIDSLVYYGSSNFLSQFFLRSAVVGLLVGWLGTGGECRLLACIDFNRVHLRLERSNCRECMETVCVIYTE
jgi:hypothetical protein